MWPLETIKRMNREAEEKARKAYNACPACNGTGYYLVKVSESNGGVPVNRNYPCDRCSE